MAAFNFPNSPSTNDLHTENSVTWKWNGTVWKRQGVAGAQGAQGHQGVQGAPGTATINNNAVNRLITGSNTTGELNGNTYATWNGNNFALRGGEGQNCTIELASDEGDDNADFWRTMAQASDNALAIDHYATGSWVEKLRITSSGQVSISSDGTADGLLTIKGASDQVSTPSIRLLCGSDTREVSITNTSGDFVASVHGNDNAIHGHIKMFESGIFDINNGGATGSNVMRLRIDSSGRVLIGSTAKAGDSALQVYTSDRKHPAIRTNSPNANGYTLLGDAYTADESQVNIGVSYSSSSLVLGFGCKVSDSADNAFLSSQDTYSTRPCALKLGTEGDLRFYTTETNATTTTDSAVSLTQVFSIDRVGNIRQKISNRYMYFGANQELQVGVVGSDPVIDALSGDLQVKNSGATLFVGRSDHTQFYQDIKMNNDKGISFINADDTATGETVSSSVLDDYEEGSFSPTYDAPNQSSAGFSHYHNYGRYTKVGDIVTVNIYIQGHCSSNAGGGGNDDIKIVGLPFTPASNTGSGDGRYAANFAIGSRYKLECDDLTAYCYAGNTHIDLLVPSNGGTGTMLKTNQADQNTTQFWGTATYRAA